MPDGGAPGPDDSEERRLAVVHSLFVDHYVESHDAMAAAVHAGLPASAGFDIVISQPVQELLVARRRIAERRAWCAEQLRRDRIGEILAHVRQIQMGESIEPEEAQYRLRAADIQLKALGAYVRRTQVQIGRGPDYDSTERRGLSPEMARSIREDVLGVPKLRAVDDGDSE
jgi:hypothetical protein